MQLTSALSSRLCSLCIFFTCPSPAARILRISIPPPSTQSSTADAPPLPLHPRPQIPSSSSRAPARSSTLPRLLLSSATARRTPPLRTSNINDVDVVADAVHAESNALRMPAHAELVYRELVRGALTALELRVSSHRLTALALSTSSAVPSSRASNSHQTSLRAVSRPLRIAATCSRAASSQPSPRSRARSTRARSALAPSSPRAHRPVPDSDAAAFRFTRVVRCRTPRTRIAAGIESGACPPVPDACRSAYYALCGAATPAHALPTHSRRGRCTRDSAKTRRLNKKSERAASKRK
ncbi:hypothetical protein DFH06DRAFT_1482169 [Mycena polygramma]|nr:hypothetical protein DFH06DRAFT_1482169 [Mycena polygramma]